MNRVEKISALIGDVALPLMGYFLWNWNLYFILLFFLLDQLARVVLLPWRMKLTDFDSSEKRIQLLKATFLLLTEVIVIHAVIYFQRPSIDFLAEFGQFFHYKDMGIEQGYILFPLVFLGEWMRIKNELKFNIVGQKQKMLLAKSLKNAFIRISFFALILGVLTFVFLPEWLIVFPFLAVVSLLVFWD
ncbi:MAG: hypothetical protein FGM14_02820 [Flavobacteriales bacterium]|nr:hypothetical protein [Flavobacteriales bacterium]